MALIRRIKIFTAEFFPLYKCALLNLLALFTGTPVNGGWQMVTKEITANFARRRFEADIKRRPTSPPMSCNIFVFVILRREEITQYVFVE